MLAGLRPQASRELAEARAVLAGIRAPQRVPGLGPIGTPAARMPHRSHPAGSAPSAPGFKVRGRGRQDAQTTSQPSSNRYFPRPI